MSSDGVRALRGAGGDLALGAVRAGAGRVVGGSLVVRVSARDQVAKALAQRPDATAAELAFELRMSVVQVARHLAIMGAQRVKPRRARAGGNNLAAQWVVRR